MMRENMILRRFPKRRFGSARYGRLALFCMSAAILGPALAAQAPSAAQPDLVDAPLLVRDAVAKARGLSFYRDRVDWSALTERMLAATRDARDSIDMIAAYDLLIEALNDGHSFVNVAAEDRKAYEARTGRRMKAAHPRVRSPFLGRNKVEQRSAAAGNGQANVVVVPAFSGGGVRGDAYASRVFAAVMGGSTACGHVIDLRGNSGGNQWPMIAGLSPLLGDSSQGLEVRPGGIRKIYAVVRKGQVREAAGGISALSLASVANWNAPKAMQRKPVAVLVDGDTASSGAGVAIAFHGRGGTRFFGQRTHPTTTSNEGFVLADGTNIVVTSALMADREWKTFPGGLKPDVEVKPTSDAEVEALEWLGSTRECRKP